MVVDPSWQYAPYFVVQQGSTASEGDWTPITRDCIIPVLPRPAWIVFSALLALASLAYLFHRRRLHCQPPG